MTKKEILIKDLCSRLSYKPIVHIENSATGVSSDQELNPLHIIMLTENDIVIIKPYLRHGFDTKEERQEYSKIDDVVEAMDYMLAKHIDCRDMVENGLALEAPKGMYKS